MKTLRENVEFQILIPGWIKAVKESNANAGKTYDKVANTIRDLDFEITADNAKGLGKGKTKVPGIGKGSAEKIFDIITTGTTEKLEEKRAAHK